MTDTAGQIGRPSMKTPELLEVFCERMANGMSVKSICKMDDMPSERTINNWLNNDPDFVQQYTRAREQRADNLIEEILEISDEDTVTTRMNGEVEEVVFDSTAVARNRLRVDTRKWIAARMSPRKWGDKLAIGGAEDLPPIKTQTDVALDDRLAELLAKNGADES